MQTLTIHYLPRLLRTLLLFIPFAASVQAQDSLPRVAVSHPVFAYAEAVGTVDLEINPHVLGGVEFSHSADGELFYLLPQGCGFICPGATPEDKTYPFRVPALAPGAYQLHFSYGLNNPTMLSIDLEVEESAIEVSAAERVLVLPEQPVGYAPFRIDVFTARDNVLADFGPATVKVVDGTIFLEYQEEPGSLSASGDNLLSVPVQGLPPGHYQVKVSRRAADGQLTLEREAQVNIAASSQPKTVFSLFHPDNGHYFMTISEFEHNLLLGQGWLSVDGGFYAWDDVWGRPENAHPVCRFYSKLVNSHFYTADPGECELLSEGDQGWLFEGNAMWAIVPTAGACPAGTVPVWRLYNDRYAELDSNHRFVVDNELYRSMISRGWIGEGVAFCSPQPGG